MCNCTILVPLTRDKISKARNILCTNYPFSASRVSLETSLSVAQMLTITSTILKRQNEMTNAIANATVKESKIMLRMLYLDSELLEQPSSGDNRCCRIFVRALDGCFLVHFLFMGTILLRFYQIDIDIF